MSFLQWAARTQPPTVGAAAVPRAAASAGSGGSRGRPLGGPQGSGGKRPQALPSTPKRPQALRSPPTVGGAAVSTTRPPILPPSFLEKYGVRGVADVPRLVLLDQRLPTGTNRQVPYAGAMEEGAVRAFLESKGLPLVGAGAASAGLKKDEL